MRSPRRLLECRCARGPVPLRLQSCRGRQAGMMLSVHGRARIGLKLASVVAVLALAPATAARAVPTASVDGGTVTVDAPRGEANQIHPKLFPCPQCAPSGSLYLVQDKSFLSTLQNVIAGPGCTANASG